MTNFSLPKSILAAVIGTASGLMIACPALPKQSSLEQQVESSFTPYEEHASTLSYPYQDLIHDAEVSNNISQHLYAALINVESSFNPISTSKAGAKGLSQLMEAAAKEVGVTDRCSPEQSILGGAAYLRRMYDIFSREQGLERWKFALGAYNAGPNNIIACQKIIEAAQQGKNSITIQRGNKKHTYENIEAYAVLSQNQWESIATILPVVTKSHAIETTNYVQKVMKVYGYYLSR